MALVAASPVTATGANLTPYLDPLASQGAWLAPSWSGAYASAGSGNDSSGGTLAFAGYTPSGDQAGSLHTGGFTSDLGSFFGAPLGIAAPDWSAFWHPAQAAQGFTMGGNDSGNGTWIETAPAIDATFDQAGANKAFDAYQSSIATRLGLDPSKHYVFSNQNWNPTSTDHAHDFVDALYELSADGSTYKPIWATPDHVASSWVQNRGLYLEVAAGLATVLTAGAASGAFGALGGAATSTSTAMVDGAFLGEGAASGIAAWDTALASAAAGVVPSAMVDGAFLGEGIASGVPAWDAAAINAGLTLSTPATLAAGASGAAGAGAGFTLPSLSTIGQALGTLGSAVGLVKAVAPGLLGGTSSSSTGGALSPAQLAAQQAARSQLLLLAAAAAVAVLLLRKGHK